MQEMKLFDIETGKYLELGTDWLYGGNGILLIDIMQKELNESLEIAITNAIQGNEHALYQYSYGEMKTEPQGTLKTLCDLTGAVVYGGRYVLLGFKEYCDEELRKIVDIVTDGLCVCDRVWDGWNVGTMSRDDFRQFDDGDCEDVSNDKVDDLKKSIDKQYMALEIFEEYSKSLRNEENKLEQI